MEMHAGQLSVSPRTVRALVAEHFPQWRDQRIEAVASVGTVNAIFRIGERFVARFPLEFDEVAVARQRLEHEAAVAEELIDRTPFPHLGPSRSASLGWATRYRGRCTPGSPASLPPPMNPILWQWI
jgi:aminoglycoside phosphotransferase (APT) family kinase protein